MGKSEQWFLGEETKWGTSETVWGSNSNELCKGTTTDEQTRLSKQVARTNPGRKGPSRTRWQYLVMSYERFEIWEGEQLEGNVERQATLEEDNKAMGPKTSVKATRCV